MGLFIFILRHNLTESLDCQSLNFGTFLSYPSRVLGLQVHITIFHKQEDFLNELDQPGPGVAQTYNPSYLAD